MSEQQWQPIETAPKDGTKVLAYDGFDCVVMHWNFASGDWYTESICCEEFTHWMPLPDPPTPEGSTR